MTLLAAATAGRRTRNPYTQRDRLRVSQRLAAGMTPAEAARAEGCDEAAVHALLEQVGFRGLVASYRALAERPAAEQTARLVKLARIAIENVLSEWDVGASLFVLRENARGRDPAETVARGVVAASRRATNAAAGAAPSRAPPVPASSTPQARPYDPGLRLLKRGSARLRRALTEEHAIRHAATTAERTAVDSDATAIVMTARKALALKAATARPSASPLAQLTRRLAGEAGFTSLRPHPPGEVEHPAIAGRLRRPRPP